MSNLRVRLFAADPLSVDGHELRLQLDKEVERIEHEVLLATHRDRVDFKSCWATTIDAMGRELNRARPQIVHFSGHGGKNGLVLVSETGQPHRVGAAALEEFFRAYGTGVQLVVLNACHSQPEAEAIARAVGCAIGIPNPISDGAAIKFSGAFYSAITFGHSVAKAFHQACATLNAHDFAKGEWPVLERGDVDPSELFLIPSDPVPVVQEPLTLVTTAGPTGPVRSRKRVFGQAGLLVCVVAAAVIFWPPKLPPACRAARDVLASVRETKGAPAPLGLMGGAPASSGAAADLMDDARDLYAAGNFQRAFPLFKQAAIAGDEEAMSYVGVAYLRGEGVPPNPDSATKWLEPAKGNREPRGMNGVGEAHQRGVGSPPSDRWATHWYREAAEEGFAEAMRNLGNMYRGGLSVEASGETALDWYVKAARAGFVDAMVDAGMMYENGSGVPVDLDAARCWYDAAAKAGSSRGMVERGRMHEAAGEYRQAKNWYQQGADLNDADAINNLGRLYQNGWGVSVDLDQARRLYRRAADLGSEVGRGNFVRLSAG